MNLSTTSVARAQDQPVLLPVPEPASLILLGTGLAGLAARRRKLQLMPVRVALITAVAVAIMATPLAAVTVAGLGDGAARAMSALTEPGALLVWGTVLAGLARALGRRRHKA